MRINESETQERRETIEEFSELFFVVQEMGRRLANETHGPAYDMVQKLNQLLHQVRVQIGRIEESSSDA